MGVAEIMLQNLIGERISYRAIGISIQVDPTHQMLPLLVEQANNIDKRELVLFRPISEIAHESRMNQKIKLVT